MSPDFLRCTGDFCPIKEHCLRYTMLVAGRQDFFGKPPFHSETGTVIIIERIDRMHRGYRKLPISSGKRKAVHKTRIWNSG